MPRGDGTGPAKMGPMTGRTAGYCAGYITPGFANPQVGAARRGGAFSGGFARGRRHRNMYYATGLPGWARFDPYADAGAVPNPPDYSAEDEIAQLKEQAQILKEQLDDISARISQMTAKEQKEP
jgi:hypothetical protein